MEQGEVVHIVGQSCRPDQEEKLTRWYEEVHIPGLLEFKGLRKAYCCQLLYDGKTHPDFNKQNYPKFLNVYEFDNSQAFEEYERWLAEEATVGHDVRATWNEDPVERIWRVQYKIVKVLER